MKREWKKILIACVAIMCVIFPNAISAIAEENGVIKELSGGGISQYYSDISSYRDDTFTVTRTDEEGNEETITYYNNELSAPSGYEGYIFAGWYTNNTCTTTLGSDVTSGEAYAKFVPKEILGIKAQIEAGTEFGSDSSSIRFVTTVDSLMYETVGFDFKINEKTLSAESQEVYKRLEAKGADDRVLNYTPAKTFHEMSKYFMACTVTNVQNEDFGHGIFVTPYWITNDGTKVYSKQDMRTINMGYMPYATNVTASLATASAGIERPSDTQASSQGGCTDGTYYYQATLCDISSLTADNAATTGTTKIQRYRMENSKWVLDSASSSLLPLAHANDMTYNENLTYEGQAGSGLLVVCHNEPVWTRVSFVDPDTLAIVKPSAIKNMGWNSESTDLDYIELSQKIFSIDYNAAKDSYVVGISGTKNFCVLNSSMEVVGDIKKTNSVPTGFVNQGVGSDDSYIYFVYFNNANNQVEGYDTHVIAVYDWDGKPVTVMNISNESIGVGTTITTKYEPENISIYDNTIYVSCNKWIPVVDTEKETFVYKVDSMTVDYPDSVAEIVRDTQTFGYFTLEDAVADAQKGETITLLSDVTVDSTMEMLAKDVTLTADSNVTIKRGADVTLIDVAEGGSLTIDGNITLDGNKDVVTGTTNFITNAGTFTLGRDAAIKNVVNTKLRAIYSTAGTVNLYGTLSGNETGTGVKAAVVRIMAGTLNVDGATFENNSGGFGSAIYVDAGTLNVDGATFTGNSGKYGGAIYLCTGVNATIQNSSFTENNSSDTEIGGGALYSESTALTVKECDFTSNTAESNGGAIRVKGNADLESLTFIQNSTTSENGGTVYNNGGKIKATGCTFKNDDAGTFVNASSGTVEIAGDMSGATFVYTQAVESVVIADAGITNEITISPSSYKTDYVAVGGAIASVTEKVVVTANEGFPYEVTAEGKLALEGELKNAEAAISPTQYGTLSDMIVAANADTNATLEDPAVITVLKQDIELSSTLDVTGYVKLTTIKDNDVTIIRKTQDYMFQIATAEKNTGSLNIDGHITLDGNSNDIEFEKDAPGQQMIYSYGQSLTIGPKASIVNYKASNYGGAIRNDAGTVTLYGTFSGNEGGSGTSGKGSVVRIEGGTLRVESGATFNNNTSVYGGAIYANNATVFIDDATFTGNSASRGGGALYFEKSVTANITETDFLSNEYTGASSSYDGGAILQGSSCTTTMTGCTFQGNTTSRLAQSVYNSGSMNVSDCTFVDQTFVNTGTKGITEISGLLTGVQFVNNTDNVTTVVIGTEGLERGSLIKIKPKSYTADRVVLGVQAADTEEQTAKNLANAASIIDVVQPTDAYWYLSDDGKLTQATTVATDFATLNSAIESASTTEATTIYLANDITITENISIPSGKDITLKGKNGVKLTRESDIIMFTIGDDTNGGGSLNVDGAIVIDGNKDVPAYANNLIKVYGTFTLGRNATIKDVKGTSSRRALYGYDTTIINLYGTLSGHVSTTDGAAVKMSAKGGTLYIDGAIFKDNSASYGGAISLNVNGITATIKNATFSNNTSSSTGGGAIYSKSDLTVNGGTFENNSSVSGGAIYLTKDVAEATITDALFSGNKSTTNGGGAIYSLGQLTLTNSIFRNNQTTGSGNGEVGGAVRIGGGTFTVNGSTFEKNSSRQGGAIHLMSATKAEINNASFSINESTNAGGGAIYSESELTLTSSVFTNNVGTEGGAIHCQNTTLIAKNCTFEGNEATTKAGGAIRLIAKDNAEENATITVSGGTFEDNRAATNGGAISVNRANITVNNSCSFIKNTATSNGGAIRIDENYLGETPVTISLDDLTFKDNAAKKGSAIYNASTSEMSTDTCTFGTTDSIYPAE